MKDLRSLVTGCAGFIGANLVRELLDRGSVVHLFIRPQTDQWRLAEVLSRVHVHAIDLQDRLGVQRAVADINPDAIFHLAKHRGNPATLDYRSAYADNLDGTLNLLEAAAGSSRLKRFVHAGSSLEYDLKRSPLKEGDAPAPLTVHGVTKAAATLLSQHFAKCHRVPSVVLRFFTVYGPWEGAARFVPSAIRAAIERQPLSLTRPGLRHDWVYVGDVIDACIRAVPAERIDGEILNIATGTETTNEEILQLVEEICGRSIAVQYEPFVERAWDTEHWVADVSKTERLLGWSAPTTLRRGLERTLEFRKLEVKSKK